MVLEIEIQMMFFEPLLLEVSGVDSGGAGVPEHPRNLMVQKRGEA
jgi:hypothetical protein